MARMRLVYLIKREHLLFKGGKFNAYVKAAMSQVNHHVYHLNTNVLPPILGLSLVL